MRIKENYQYLLRCIDRFTKLLASANPKAFVLLSPESRMNTEQFVSLHNTLANSTSNCCLIVITLKKPRNDMPDFGIDYIKGIGPSCLAAMRPISKEGSLRFEHPFDDFMFRRAIVAFGVEARKPPLIEVKDVSLQ